MTDAEILFGIMASLGKERYSVQSLICLAHPLGIVENSVRTTLHRMQKKGTLSAIKEGKRAFYSFSDKGRKISKNVEQGFSTPDWSGWENEWWGVLYSVPEKSKPLRHVIRTKLELYRFASWYPGFWIRPRNPDNEITRVFDNDTMKSHCSIIRFLGIPELSVGKIQTLWKLETVNRKLGGALRTVCRGMKTSKKLSPETAFRKKIQIGSHAVAALFSDPLLPDEYMPHDWKAPQLRAAFQEFDQIMTDTAGPFLNDVFKDRRA